MSQSQPLPPKEHGIFKRILKCYEQKQYKSGLKFAKQILTNPKFHDHGETLAMRGLTYNAMGRKEEAYDEVKRGLKNDIKSHICWHVYGVLQRADKKYDEAIKCYRNALKLDPDNLQILRDLSLLQIQMRDLEGFKETRYRLLQLKPSQRNGWLGYAISYHLLKDHTMAAAIISQYRQCTSERVPYENAELALFENYLHFEAGQYQVALDHLEANDSVILDRLSYQETWGKLLEALGRREHAASIYQILLMRNPENRAYYAAVERTTLPATEEERLAIYDDVARRRPYASLPKRLVLDFLTGDRLRERLAAYMRKYFLKGFAPLFNLLRGLYSDKEKVQLIGDLVEGYLECHAQCGKFDVNDEDEAPPSVEIWMLVYMAHHYSYTHDIERALQCVNRAIEHTPTLVELYMLKGKIYKRAGNYLQAALWVDEGRLLDTADRYVNCLCAKYLIRSDQIKRAEEICENFTRDGACAEENLNEMQCMWFQTECALSYQKQGKWGEALRKCHQIERHFVDMIEDQFDFHSYCLRKMTLRTYVGLLRLEDNLRSHPFYFKTAKLAIEIYLHLYEHPHTSSAGEAGLAGAEMTEAEKKKIRNKERKAKKKAQKEDAAAAAAAAAAQKKDSASGKNSEADKETTLRAEDLVRTSQPLEEAIKFLKPLQQMAAGRIETHLLAYRIYSKKRKFLMMLLSVKKARAIDANHPELHEHVVDFALAVNNSSNDLKDVVRRIVDEELLVLLDSKDVATFNRLYLERNATSLRHLISGSKVLCRLKPDETQSSLALVTNLSDDLEDRRADTCSSVLEALLSGAFGVCSDTVASYKAACHKLFPHAGAFSSEEKDAKVGDDAVAAAAGTEEEIQAAAAPAENSLRDEAVAAAAAAD